LLSFVERKTACVRAIVADLQREQSTGAVASFRFVTLNGMELPTPADAYTRLLEQVSRDKTSLAPDKAAKALEEIFTGESSESQGTTKTTTFVLLVDELDYLVTRKETLMYNLFHWPRRALEIQSPNRLVVVGISNTLNLPESLHTRVQSRIGTSRCSFPSYTASEIASILNAKVKKAAPNCTVFAKDAIEFASKKTARSGDIRRALRVCRDAAELVLEEYECWDGTGERPSLVVTIQDVNLCAQDPLKAGLSLAVQHASVFEALLLAALAHLGLRTGRDSAGFDVEEIVFKMEAMASALGDKQYLPPPCLAETLDMISRLAEAHIISCKTPRNASLSYRSHISGSGGPWPLITLGMADADVGVALSKSVFHKELARKYFG
jgi:Cdc6-like AAA superfamily ATPase